MRVMVTGAGGMLADAVGDRLARSGDEAFGVFFSGADAQAAAARWPRGVVFELGRGRRGTAWLDELERAAADFRPDWIFHLAAWTDVDGCEADPERALRSNADSGLEVALVARGCGARLLAVSTDYVFDGLADTPRREDAPTAPASAYGRSKLAGEGFVRTIVPGAVIARTAWLYGPGGRNFVDTIKAKLEQGEPVRVVNDQRGCPTFTADLAGGLHTLAAHGADGVVHVANTGDATWFDLACATGAHLGRGSLVSPMTTAELNRPAPRPRYSVLDTSRFASIAGAPLPDWRDALRRHLEHRTA